MAGGAGLWPSDIIGGLLWGLGFFCEATADWQKLRFKLDPANKGRYINTGEASSANPSVLLLHPGFL